MDDRLYHGGRLAAARRRYPEAAEPFVDLSTGINPVPYPLPSLPKAAYARLPEPEDEAALQAAAAGAYDVSDPAMAAAAPGTQILIGLLPLLFPSRRVGVLAPTYTEHAACWRAAGAEVREARDLADLAGTDAAVVCVPNNPDGRRPELGALREVADRVSLLVVDAAFADLEDGPDATGLLPHPAVVVLRSFGKTYGLAGLRLGFALAAPARAEAIRAALGPWAVSGPAIAIGRAALGDAAWRAAARGRLAEDVARLDGILTQAGMAIVGGTRLFRLAAADDAQARYERLARAGILVRRFDDHPAWLRFGVPGEASVWQRLAAALLA
ncbi:MAG TPA: threonine-phosphate decarboxylase CobD [Acetobacteraceae bacterium]|jgi:cobalamin biosynthetic protein CobC|nr:threonine-phosphate decarboxylase CobD [Acetobacteraceae bacterium]